MTFVVSTLALELPDFAVRALLTAGFAVLVGVAALLMRRAWRGKAAEFEDLPPLTPIADGPIELSVSGRYLSTTVAGDWLRRIVAQGLGMPSRAEAQVSADGLGLARTGSPSFFISKGAVLGVRADRAIAGKAFERDGIIVVTWQHGRLALDTGFRADSTEDHLRLLAAIGDWKTQ